MMRMPSAPSGQPDNPKPNKLEPMGISRKHLLFAGMAALVLGIAGPLVSQDPKDADKAKESAALKAIASSEGTFVGAKKCKMCHNKVGETFDKWEKGPHAGAFETLKSDKAKAIAKEKGLEDASKAPECLKCHVTAFSMLEDEEKVDKKFPMEMGVQCEACHGPGGDHAKARMKAKSKITDDVLPAGLDGEMTLPDLGLCLSCHNEESPTFKEFKYGERLKAIAHLHPLREKPRVEPPKKEKDAE